MKDNKVSHVISRNAREASMHVPLSMISNAPVERKWVSSMLLRKKVIRQEKICNTQTACQNYELIMPMGSTHLAVILTQAHPPPC